MYRMWVALHGYILWMNGIGRINDSFALSQDVYWNGGMIVVIESPSSVFVLQVSLRADFPHLSAEPSPNRNLQCQLRSQDHGLVAVRAKAICT